MVSPMMMGIQKTRRSVWAGVDVELLTTTEIHRYSMSEFSGSILQVGIAKICSRLGFDFAEKHALDMLVDVVGKYIETIGLYVIHVPFYLVGPARFGTNDLSF